MNSIKIQAYRQPIYQIRPITKTDRSAADFDLNHDTDSHAEDLDAQEFAIALARALEQDEARH